MTERDLRNVIRKEIKKINESHELEVMQGFNAVSVDPATLHSLITYTLSGVVTGFVAKKIADTIIDKLRKRKTPDDKTARITDDSKL